MPLFHVVGNSVYIGLAPVGNATVQIQLLASNRRGRMATLAPMRALMVRLVCAVDDQTEVCRWVRLGQQPVGVVMLALQFDFVQVLILGDLDFLARNAIFFKPLVILEFFTYAAFGEGKPSPYGVPAILGVRHT